MLTLQTFTQIGGRLIKRCSPVWGRLPELALLYGYCLVANGANGKGPDNIGDSGQLGFEISKMVLITNWIQDSIIDRRYWDGGPTVPRGILLDDRQLRGVSKTKIRVKPGWSFHLGIPMEGYCEFPKGSILLWQLYPGEIMRLIDNNNRSVELELEASPSILTNARIVHIPVAEIPPPTSIRTVFLHPAVIRHEGIKVPTSDQIAQAKLKIRSLLENSKGRKDYSEKAYTDLLFGRWYNRSDRPNGWPQVAFGALLTVQGELFTWYIFAEETLLLEDAKGRIRICY